jgi:hypothetical protein
VPSTRSPKTKLRDAISKLRVHELYRHSEQSCPDIDYYVADLIVNKRDQAAFDSAVEETMSCAHLTPNMRPEAEGMVRAASGQALSLGDQDMRVTLSTVRQVVAKMADLPGQRLLVLISPGFLTVTMEAMAAKSQILDLAARSNVTVSALDARGLHVGGRDVSAPRTRRPMRRSAARPLGASWIAANTATFSPNWPTAQAARSFTTLTISMVAFTA